MRVNVFLIVWFGLLILSSIGVWCPAPDIKVGPADTKMRIGDIEMFLVVVSEDGKCQKIRLVFPVEVKRGKHLDKIACGCGTEYFFTKEGYYDGWGRPVSGDPEKLEVMDPQFD